MDIFKDPVYFNPYSSQLVVNQGTLPDGTFLGTLMAVAAYSKYDLIENIFASRPEDFLNFGIYTCRFYVDGDWVEVITDTSIPCIKDNFTGKFTPVYGYSDNPSEMWLSFAEKAFAKAMGSYEEIPNIKIQKALLHLTGGSVQYLSLRDEVARLDAVSDYAAWNEFKRRCDGESIVILIPTELKEPSVADEPPVESSSGAVEGKTVELVSDGQENQFIPEMLYSVVLVKDINGYELVLMHNPWKDPTHMWTGEWSDLSNDWDLYPEILNEIEHDPEVPWRRKQPNGYFWISFRHLSKLFNKAYFCKIFPNEKYHFYCAKGECRGRQAGGPLTTIRDKDVVLKEAGKSRVQAAQKATAAVVLDGDPAWFNNPQFRLHFPAPVISTSTNGRAAQGGSGTATVYISAVPMGTGEEDFDQAPNVYLTVASTVKGPSQPEHLWEVSHFDLMASDRTEGAPVRVKGQETSIWGIEMDYRRTYHIVVNTARRGLEADFILRVFATRAVTLESVNPLHGTALKGEWKRVGDQDSTGGPLHLHAADGSQKENPKWCQNPQFHLELADLFGKDEIFLKIVVRRADKHSKHGGHHSSKGGSQHSSSNEQKKLDATIGMVLTKASVLEDATTAKAKKKQPRQNKLGEPIPSKMSSLKKNQDLEADELIHRAAHETPKTILRKLSVEPSSYHLSTSFTSKQEACVFFPKLPRSWIPNGLMVVPCLSEKSVKGGFELEVFCSETVYVNPLPETYSRTVAGDWAEASAGGSRLFPSSFKKNPKFTLRFHYPVNSEEPARVRITVARHGANWKAMCKKDTVGCMIGFYIFINRHGELTQIFESTFVPDAELSTEPNFSLPQLSHGEVYTIMPTTFHDAKVGAFVLSIMSEFEFTVFKEKT